MTEARYGWAKRAPVIVEDIMDYYSTKDAAARSGASRQAIRAYTARHARYFSTEGAPTERGQARKFTEADIKLLAFIRHLTTDQGLTHDAVGEQLAAGALDKWVWASHSAPSATEERQEATGTLVSYERLQAALALLNDTKEREDALAAQLEASQAEIRALERALGKAEGELTALKGQPKGKGFWARLLGGSA